MESKDTLLILPYSLPLAHYLLRVCKDVLSPPSRHKNFSQFLPELCHFRPGCLHFISKIVDASASGSVLFQTQWDHFEWTGLHSNAITKIEILVSNSS